MVLGCPRIAGCALSMNGWEGRWHPTLAPPLTRSSLPGSSMPPVQGQRTRWARRRVASPAGHGRKGRARLRGRLPPLHGGCLQRPGHATAPKEMPHPPSALHGDSTGVVPDHCSEASLAGAGSGPQFVKNATSAKLGQGRSACTSQVGLSAMKGVLRRDRHRKRPWVMEAGTLERPEAQRGGRKLGPATPQSQRRAGPEPARARFCRVKSASVGTYGKRTACIFLQRIKHPNATGLLEGAGGNMGRRTCLRKQWHNTCGRGDVRRQLYLG